jgi:hypothetical protein
LRNAGCILCFWFSLQVAAQSGTWIRPNARNFPYLRCLFYFSHIRTYHFLFLAGGIVPLIMWIIWWSLGRMLSYFDIFQDFPNGVILTFACYFCFNLENAACSSTGIYISDTWYSRSILTSFVLSRSFHATGYHNVFTSIIFPSLLFQYQRQLNISLFFC